MKRPKRRHQNSQRAKKARTNDAHRAWVRLHECSVSGCKNVPVEAAHYDGPVPYESRGGTGLKDHDKWVLSLCFIHHAIYHVKGWAPFEKEFGINTKAIAEQFWLDSPHGKKARREEEQARVEAKGGTLWAG